MERLPDRERKLRKRKWGMRVHGRGLRSIRVMGSRVKRKVGQDKHAGRWTQEDEAKQKALLERIIHHQDKEAMETLVVQCEGLVHKIVRPYARPPAITIPMLMQIGRVGVFLAAQSYNPRKGTFVNYAHALIKGELQHYFRTRAKNQKRIHLRLLDHAEGKRGTGIEGREEQGFAEVEYRDVLNRVMKKMTPRQRFFLSMMRDGYKPIDIFRASDVMTWKEVKREWEAVAGMIRKAFKNDDQE